MGLVGSNVQCRQVAMYEEEATSTGMADDDGYAVDTHVKALVIIVLLNFEDDP